MTTSKGSHARPATSPRSPGGRGDQDKWDLSTAGQLKDGKPFHVDDFIQSDGQRLHTNLSTKGTFEWGENVKPHYAWFDGQMRYTLAEQKIDPSRTVELNSFKGSANDPRSRIWPFKRMQGRQAYDTKLLNLVHNQVFGPETDTAFWTNFDYTKSIKAAKDYIGQPYSGEFGFVDTYMYWPITHMVAPKGDALACNGCHGKAGRLAGVTGVYLPGAHPMSLADILGLLLLFATAGGVLVHTGLRFVTSRGGQRHD